MGVRGPFSDMKDDALVYFYGTEEEIGIKQDLADKVETAYSLMSVAKRYISEDDSLVTDLTDACVKVQDAEDPLQAYEANLEMDECYYALRDKLASVKLTEKDSGYNASLLADYQSSDMIISHSEYNVIAEKINEEMSEFPANILTKIAFVEKMVLFR